MSWTFLTNHGAVLGLIAKHGQITASQIAVKLDITERSVQRIIKDLHDAGYVQRTRQGRTNHYRVNQELPLRVRTVRDVPVGDLIKILI